MQHRHVQVVVQRGAFDAAHPDVIGRVTGLQVEPVIALGQEPGALDQLVGHPLQLADLPG